MKATTSEEPKDSLYLKAKRRKRNKKVRERLMMAVGKRR